MADLDVDKLPPTQYLILEVLAARYRLGEMTWPFPNMLRPALTALAGHGLVDVDSHPPGCRRVRLTAAGITAVISNTYQPPAQRPGRPEPRDPRAPHSHVCVTCTPDDVTPGPGCGNCRNTGMDQTPCRTPGHFPQCPRGCCDQARTDSETSASGGQDA